MLCKWHIFAVWKVLSFLWLSVLKFHDDVTVGLFSSIDQLGWAIGGLFNLETHVFQFWEFLFNFFFYDLLFHCLSSLFLKSLLFQSCYSSFLIFFLVFVLTHLFVSFFIFWAVSSNFQLFCWVFHFAIVFLISKYV